MTVYFIYMSSRMDVNVRTRTILHKSHNINVSKMRLQVVVVVFLLGLVVLLLLLLMFFAKDIIG
mgnify:CR=1 FL=1